MIPEKDLYSKEEVAQLLRWQHISTKNKCLAIKTFCECDDGERERVGKIRAELNDVSFSDTDIAKKKSGYKFPTLTE